MTEKRFVGYFDKDHNYIIQDLIKETEYQVGFVHCDEDVFLEMINEIADENEQLKKDCTVLIYHNQEYRKENEQLKKDCSNLIDDNTEYVSEINQMHKENEKLKSEIKDLNDVLARYEEKELEE